MCLFCYINRGLELIWIRALACKFGFLLLYAFSPLAVAAIGLRLRASWTLALGAILVLAVTEVAHGSSIAAFVSILPQKHFVERIAGSHVEITRSG